MLEAVLLVIGTLCLVAQTYVMVRRYIEQRRED